MYDDLSLPSQTTDLAWTYTPRGRRMARLRLLLATIASENLGETSQLSSRYRQYRHQEIRTLAQDLRESEYAYYWPLLPSARDRWAAFETLVITAKG